MPVTAFYAALLAPVFLWLSIRTVRTRRKVRVAIGDGGDDGLARAMRAQANFAEYVPFALLLLALGESMNLSIIILHVLGIVLLVGRCVHACGITREPEPINMRVAGMVATFTVIGVAAVFDLIQAMTSFVAMS